MTKPTVGTMLSNFIFLAAGACWMAQNALYPVPASAASQSDAELKILEHEFVEPIDYKKCSEGIRRLDRLINLNSKNGHLYYLKGLAYHHRAYALSGTFKGYYQARHEYLMAQICYDKAIDLGFRTADAYYMRGETKEERRKYAQAIPDLNKSIELDPKKDGAWAIRGTAYIGMHQYKQAQSDLKKAVELSPNNCWNYLRLAILEEKLGAVTYARQLLDKALTLDPNSTAIRHHRARLAIRTRDFATAEKDLSYILRIDPDNGEALKMRAELNLKQGQAEQAQADFVSGDEISSSVLTPEKNQHKITAIEAKSLLRQSVSDYSTNIKLNNTDTLYELAVLHWGLANWTSSTGYFQKFLSRQTTVGAPELHAVALSALAMQSQKSADRGKALLRKYKTSSGDSSIMKKTIAYLCGDLPLSKLESSAINIESKTIVNFYAGALLAREGHLSEAKEKLLWVIDKGDPHMDQYILAVMELDRLQNGSKSAH